MKGIKYRYDENKLKKNSSLKKRMALYLAQEFIKITSKEELNIIEIVAYGQKNRPFIAYSEKDLIKLIDESYMKKLEAVSEAKKNYEEAKNQGQRSWIIERLKNYLQEMEAAAKNVEDLVNEVIEKTFSE